MSKLDSSKNLLISAFADDAAGELSLFQERWWLQVCNGLFSLLILFALVKEFLVIVYVYLCYQFRWIKLVIKCSLKGMRG